MEQLFLTNIPCDCEDTELRSWIEAGGFDVDSMRVVRDLVAGVSPAFGYVSLRGGNGHADPVKLLDGQHLKGRALRVRKDCRDEHHRK